MNKTANNSRNNPKKTLGQLIQDYRDQTGTSVRELAKQLGISSSMLSAIELEKAFPRRRILEKLAKLFNLSAADLEVLDTRLRIDHLRRILKKNPSLDAALSTMVGQIREGQNSPDQFAKAIMSAAAVR